MSYAKRSGDNVITEFTAVNQAVDYNDRVRWGPIISGLVIAIGTQLVLSALGAAIGAVKLVLYVSLAIIAFSLIAEH